jgi:hypothetical protein
VVSFLLGFSVLLAVGVDDLTGVGYIIQAEEKFTRYRAALTKVLSQHLLNFRLGFRVSPNWVQKQ